MSECEHVWYFDKDANLYKCEKPNCKAGIGLFVGADRLNERAALKRLKEYATHKPGCYENSELCICGLDALLTDKPTKPPKRTARQSGTVESFGEGLVPDYLVFTDEYGRRWRLESQFEQKNDEIREHLEAFTSGLLTVEQMHLIALAFLAKTETPEEKSEGGLK